MAKKVKHASHDDVTLRLKRAHGHLGKVISMVEAEDKCLNVAQQLHAVVKALTEAKRLLVNDHIEHCLDEESIHSKQELKEFKEITKYL